MFKFLLDHAISRAGRLIYMLLLFRTDHFADVAATFWTFAHPSLTEKTLAMAALARLGTPEAFEEATRLFRVPLPDAERRPRRGRSGRLPLLYAFLAHRAGQLGHAYDVLTDTRHVSRRTKASTNLKLQILTEVGRLKEALVLIRCVFS
jgi:hypothetical protein